MRSQSRSLFAYVLGMAVAACGGTEGGEAGGGGRGGAGGGGGATTNPGNAGSGTTADATTPSPTPDARADDVGAVQDDSGIGGMGGAMPDAGMTPVGRPLEVAEFLIPRENNFPHDPAVDSKGMGWWTDQNNSYIGRWDPATNTSMDWPTPTPSCGPHGLVADDADNIWYTGQRCDRIGKLDPSTGKITEYPVPGGGGPHTPVFHEGAVWFTLQSGGAFGRVDPQSGKVETWPAGGPGPYGLWSSPDGTIWMALFGTNRIVQIDPEKPTMLRQVTLPRAGARVRRLAVDKNGLVYYGDYAEGPLGRFDPKSGEFKEWSNVPGGANAAPYGIAIGPDDRVYFFIGMDTVAVFDPVTERFDQIRIPTSGSVVRHMATDLARRRVWLALSGVRRMGYIEVP